jgi:hypothetical protein
MIVSLGAVTVPTPLLAWIQLAELAVAVKTPFNVGATRPREIQLSWAEAGNTRPSTTVTTTVDSSLDIEGLPAQIAPIAEWKDADGHRSGLVQFFS